MASLNGLDQATLELLFEMESGYVVGLSDRGFSNFIQRSTGKRIFFDRKYGRPNQSNADLMRNFWRAESDAVVGRLVAELVEYAILQQALDESDSLVLKCNAIAKRLLGAATPAGPGPTLNANDLNATNVVVGHQITNNFFGAGASAPQHAETPSAADTRLKELLTDKFDLDELKVLAFELGIDFENLSGDTKSVKVMSLIGHCQRHEKLAQLRDAVRRARPNVGF